MNSGEPTLELVKDPSFASLAHKLIQDSNIPNAIKASVAAEIEEDSVNLTVDFIDDKEQEGQFALKIRNAAYRRSAHPMQKLQAYPALRKEVMLLLFMEWADSKLISARSSYTYQKKEKMLMAYKFLTEMDESDWAETPFQSPLNIHDGLSDQEEFKRLRSQPEHAMEDLDISIQSAIARIDTRQAENGAKFTKNEKEFRAPHELFANNSEHFSVMIPELEQGIESRQSIIETVQKSDLDPIRKDGIIIRTNASIKLMTKLKDALQTCQIKMSAQIAWRESGTKALHTVMKALRAVHTSLSSGSTDDIEHNALRFKSERVEVLQEMIDRAGKFLPNYNLETGPQWDKGEQTRLTNLKATLHGIDADSMGKENFKDLERSLSYPIKFYPDLLGDLLGRAQKVASLSEQMKKLMGDWRLQSQSVENRLIELSESGHSEILQLFAKYNCLPNGFELVDGELLHPNGSITDLRGETSKELMDVLGQAARPQNDWAQQA
jgi:hypothetical protein